jgi:hypothetical protein
VQTAQSANRQDASKIRANRQRVDFQELVGAMTRPRSPKRREL